MAPRDEGQAEEYLPSDEDISFYDKHGYWVSPVIIPDAILAVAERGMTRFYADDVDEHLALDSAPPTSRALGLKPYSHWGWRPEDGNVMRKNDYATLRVKELAALARYPLIAACAARLSGAASLRLWTDHRLYKPSRYRGRRGQCGFCIQTGTSGRRAPAKTCSPLDPFSDVRRQTADVDGRREQPVDRPAANQVGERTFLGYQRGVAERNATLVPIELKRGQVSFHHCKTLHGSGPNSGRTRVVRWSCTFSRRTTNMSSAVAITPTTILSQRPVRASRTTAIPIFARRYSRFSTRSTRDEGGGRRA